AVAEQSRATVIAETPRVAIRTDSLIGTISVIGGRLDHLRLARYRETVDPKSPQIVLLSPPGARDAYYADFSWLSDAGANIKLPDSNTRWTADNQTLTVDHSVTLTWDNGQGLTFTRHFAVDQYYMFTVTNSVKNNGTAAVKLYPYGRIRRVGTPKTLNYYLLHEGLLGVLGGSLRETKYSTIAKEGTQTFDSTGGWLGITDKYWLVALVPDQAQAVQAHFIHQLESGT